jgi:toxin ParE1/3/4
VIAKPVIARALARQDVENAVDYYAGEAGADIAVQFVDALKDAYHRIGVRPGTGSPRFGHELEVPGLRSRKIARFPFLIFYLERDDHIDVWRVLHNQRDFASWLNQES